MKDNRLIPILVTSSSPDSWYHHITPLIFVTRSTEYGYVIIGGDQDKLEVSREHAVELTNSKMAELKATLEYVNGMLFVYCDYPAKEETHG